MSNLSNTQLIEQIAVLQQRVKQLETKLSKYPDTKAKENPAEISRQINSVLADVGHRIRTPMTAILGYVELLMSYELSLGEQASHLLTVHRNAKSLLLLVNDFLDLAQIESGEFRISRVDCSACRIANDVIRSFKKLASDQGVDLSVEYVFPILETIQTAPERLTQILRNLISNAIVFSERGTVRLTVRHTVDDCGKMRMQFVVSDTGIGIDDDLVQRLFGPFAQANITTNQHVGSTGLGLAVSQGLANLLGGNIIVESVPKTGSTFTLTIDVGDVDKTKTLNEAPDLDVADSELPDKKREKSLQGRVLVVDDEESIRKLLAILLVEAGLDVDLASDGEMGYERAIASMIEQNTYDLILMDVMLPNIDGYTTTKKLRRNGWTGPIVAITARAMFDDRKECLDAGCNDYVVKPIDRNTLLLTVAIHLGQSSTRRAPLASSFAGQDEIGDLIDVFAKELPDRARRISEALDNNKFQSVVELTHQLKGAASVYGFDPIAKIALAIEQQLNEKGDPAQVRATVSELENLCDRANYRK